MFNRLKTAELFNSESPAQKIQTLIIGRLMATFLLLVAIWFWNSGHLKLSFEEFPRGLFIIFLISVGLTIVYFFVLRMSENYKWQVRTQFIIDALLITALVWRTGDVTSPYATLYIVLVSVAAFYLGTRGTLAIALFSVFLFVTLTILATTGTMESYGTRPEASKVVQIIGFHIVAFLVVGLLAARLSDRIDSGEQLRETTKTLANLRVLHERIIQSIRSGLITTDLDGNIYIFNTAAEEITGYTAEEMRGKKIFSLFGNIEQTVKPILGAMLEGDSIQPRFETDLTTPDGFSVHVGYGVSPLYTETGETGGLIITFQDLTDIRSMEENVRRKDRLAAVGRVAAGLAHEIRNPLGAMRGAIQVLEAGFQKDSPQASLMEIVLRESDRLNKIITNFLTYARPRVGNFSEVSVREAVEETFTLLRHSPDVKQNHTLKFESTSGDCLISADPTQLKQIFWNLARNALNAMPNGGTLSVSLNELEHRRIQIVFKDTGCGMPPEQVEQLFEPFSNSTTGGTGLGLSIVYQIVRDHGGTINVRSRENEGTTITVELPDNYKVRELALENGHNNHNEMKTVSQPSRLEDFLKVSANGNSQN